MSLRCTEPDFDKKEQVKDDGNPTHSYLEQAKVEQMVHSCYTYFKDNLDIDTNIPELHRDRHVSFLKKGLEHLSQNYECLDASRPWIIYWIVHSLELLEIDIPEDTASKVIKFLANCQSPEGGFAGGPGQFPHLAPTYAAVNALCILGTQEAYRVIDRAKLQSFLMSRRMEDGSFTMHEGGEVDIRGAYCAASVARLTNIMCEEMFEGTPEWIVSCQTYEGGFSGVPDMEAHGGYSFCGLAALVLLRHERLCDMKSMMRWLVNRQMRFEGGFQGRTNKLVDGCYSFWQGGALPLIHMILARQGDPAISAESWMFCQGALQEYVLICCQFAGGGLVDKPGKPRDYYHTCYCLSGLSVAQHFAGGKIGHTCIIGDLNNELKPTHPVFNIGVDAAAGASSYFDKLPVPSPSPQSSQGAAAT